MKQIFEGWIADVVGREIFGGRFTVENGRIASVERGDVPRDAPVYAPGFVDGHVHIESSMLPPSEFARAAVVHGTLACVSDPHEIANVLGEEGVKWMLDDAARTKFKFLFGAPSCVPATPFETAGAVFGPEEVGRLLDDPRVGYLAEVMNFPGVIGGDARMAAILQEAKKRGKPIDGHSPGVKDEGLARYLEAGITTDHECADLEEAREKVRRGMKILIREGSAARNLETLWPLLKESPESVMLCHDDAHPDDVAVGMIDRMLARAVTKGVDVMNALRAATLNPVRHYRLDVGLLQTGDRADFVELKDLKSFKVLRSFVGGECAAEHGKCLWPRLQVKAINRFEALPRTKEDFAVPAGGGQTARIIEAIDGELFTRSVAEQVRGIDIGRDVLKIAVVNRYEKSAPVAVGFVRGFGLKQGAFASSVAHDSHNIVAVGADDAALCRAVNLVIGAKGGLSAVGPHGEAVLPLPIAGLMSDAPADEVAKAYLGLNRMVAELGCPMRAPYMTLSCMALPVIPELKITDKGLFDVGKFAPVPLWV